jgi:hypothetical protein
MMMMMTTTTMMMMMTTTTTTMMMMTTTTTTTTTKYFVHLNPNNVMKSLLYLLRQWKIHDKCGTFDFTHQQPSLMISTIF